MAEASGASLELLALCCFVRCSPGLRGFFPWRCRADLPACLSPPGARREAPRGHVRPCEGCPLLRFLGVKPGWRRSERCLARLLCEAWPGQGCFLEGFWLFFCVIFAEALIPNGKQETGFNEGTWEQREHVQTQALAPYSSAQGLSSVAYLGSYFYGMLQKGHVGISV